MTPYSILPLIVPYTLHSILLAFLPSIAPSFDPSFKLPSILPSNPPSVLPSSPRSIPHSTVSSTLHSVLFVTLSSTPPSLDPSLGSCFDPSFDSSFDPSFDFTFPLFLRFFLPFVLRLLIPSILPPILLATLSSTLPRCSHVLSLFAPVGFGLGWVWQGAMLCLPTGPKIMPLIFASPVRKSRKIGMPHTKSFVFPPGQNSRKQGRKFYPCALDICLLVFRFVWMLLSLLAWIALLAEPGCLHHWSDLLGVSPPS